MVVKEMKPYAVILLCVVWVMLPQVASAQLACYDCHGTRAGGGDSRPLDYSFRNYSTGGFPGNHRTHMGKEATAASCAKCHPGSGSFTTEHRDGRINIAANINNSPLSASYRNVTTIPQTTNPTLGSCTNVNCHFERTTPSWGTTLLYQSTSDCNGTCHSSPPLGGSGGANGSHGIHNTLFSGLNNCNKCHPDHTIPPEFAHATSAANRGPVVKSSDPVWGLFGEYTASRLDYLPSQTNKFSVCLNFYCHSTVQGLTDPRQPPQSIKAPAWGGHFSDSICGGKNCHGVGWAHPDDALKPSNAGRWQDLVSGSHAKHLKYRFNEIGNCVACHYNFSGAGGGCSACHNAHALGYSHHVQHEIHMEFDPFITVGGTYTGDSIPGTTYGRCSALYCHSDGTFKVTGVLNGYTSIAWGSGAIGCDGCHGYPPAYPSGSPKANSHAAHSGYACSRCHYTTTADGAVISTSRYHVNKDYTVAPQAAAGVSFTYVYSSTGSSCSAISCHRGTDATWGGTVECSNCHGTQNLACDGCHDSPPATASHLKHFAGTAGQAVYGATTIAEDVAPDSPVYLMNCGNCHPMEHTRHGNGVLEVELHNTSAPLGSLKSRNPASAAYSNGTTVHTDSRGFTYTSGTCSNVYCHSYTEWSTTGPVPDPAGPDLPSNLVTTRQYRNVMWGGSTLGCTGCHANPPTSSAATNDGGAGNSHSWIDPYGYENLHNFNHGYQPIGCTYCHNATVKVLNSWTRNQMDVTTMSPVPIASHAKHVNGTNDVRFDPVRMFNYSTRSYGVVSMNVGTITYDQATKTCSNVACHMPVNNACGGDTPVKWGIPYRWYSSECEKCHHYGTGCP